MLYSSADHIQLAGYNNEVGKRRREEREGREGGGRGEGRRGRDEVFFLFILQYLGSVIVKRVRGTQSTEEACLRLRVRTEGILRVY